MSEAECETGWGEAVVRGFTPPRSLISFAIDPPLQGRVTTTCYFFASAGFAASGVAGVLAAWSIRSILAPSRSFAT